jgi:type III secretory pathway component EscV
LSVLLLFAIVLYVLHLLAIGFPVLLLLAIALSVLFIFGYCVRRRTDNTIAKKKKDRQHNRQKEEGQTTQ